MKGLGSLIRAGALAVAVPAAAAAALPVATTHAADHVVDIADLVFEPANLAVRPGDTVTWINRDIVPHTATANDGSWDTGETAGGAQVSLVIGEAQVGGYYCLFHPSMRAVLAAATLDN